MHRRRPRLLSALLRLVNTEHRHSGIAWHTPHNVHHGHSDAVRTARADVLAAAYTRNPERFVRKHPEPAALPGAAWINKPLRQDEEQAHSTNP